MTPSSDQLPMRWALATPHATASEAGAAVLRDGGNAVDAALAAAAVLAVVYPNQCSIGGDVVAMVATPENDVRVVNGSGRAPAAVDVDELRRRGIAVPDSGPHSVTVPGALAAWETLATTWGSRPLAHALCHAADLARDGFAVAPGVARDLDREAPVLADDMGARSLFLSNGTPLRAGDTLRMPALARTLETLADTGVASFYDGDLGDSVVANLRRLGSPMIKADLKSHRTTLTDPVSVHFAGREFMSSGENTQGVFFLEGLAALGALTERQGMVPRPLGAEAGVVGRVLSAAASDRDSLLGDAETVQVPTEWLLSHERAEELAAWASTSGGAMLPQNYAGICSGYDRWRSGDTVAIVVTDGRGTWVSLIQSAFHAFGSGVVDPQTGILLHNRGASFSLSPASPNCLAPNRRPLHTLMPVLTRQSGAVTGAFGTMGGRAQPQIHTHLALHMAAGLHAAAAVAAPRWILGRMEAGTPEQDASTIVSAEASVTAMALHELRGAGFVTETIAAQNDGTGHAQAVVFDGEGLAAATDPRADGSALIGEGIR
jgi:gamma-glutamyltranspeptidase